MEFRVIPYDHPDSALLIAEVQQEYVVRYGDVDGTPTDPAEFAPPQGLFLVGYVDGEPVVCGGWRAHDSDGTPESEFRDGDAEIKRMYVTPRARGRGLARAVLAELERTAAAAGRTRMVLETGSMQPEAMRLYETSGYGRIPSYGYYRDSPNNRCYGKSLSDRSTSTAFSTGPATNTV